MTASSDLPALLWFKRDLRLADHVPLQQALGHRCLLPLYIFEPALWQCPDSSRRHWQFLRLALNDLNRQLVDYGSALQTYVDAPEAVFACLQQHLGRFVLYSHEETGTAFTWARDRRVAAWCRAQGIEWQQAAQPGVQRGLKDRNQWERLWQKDFSQTASPLPARLPPLPPALPASQALPEQAGQCTLACSADMPPNRKAAEARLQHFLAFRAPAYARAISSPLTAREGCSRLSSYLCYGLLGPRELLQATRARIQALQEQGDTGAARSLRAFESRLHWRTHFMQKLEDEPALEYRCLHRDYEGLREQCDERLLQAWAGGHTGFPLVDACMRCLRATGWINFRMRAMLVSFASYHLWLPWQHSARWLAQCFIDYEPGIHYPQVQMQSGTTGINAWRIYNPVIQSRRLDPQGQFIRHWCPELAGLDEQALHEPWQHGTAISRYPAPIVDPVEAGRQARRKMRQFANEKVSSEETRRVMQRHASRSFRQARPKLAQDPRRSRQQTQQLTLF